MSPASSSDAVVIDASFQAEAFEALAVNVPEAHVRLRPHDDADHVHVRGSVPEVEAEVARDVFDQRSISTHQSGDRLHLFGDRLSADVEAWRWRHRHRTAVQFEIHLPPSMDVTVQTPGGSVDAAHLASTLSLTVPGGSIQTQQVSGPVEIRGSGPELSVHHCSGPSLDLRWAAGTVTVQEITTAQTTLRTAAPTTVDGLHGPADLTVHGAPLTLRNLDGPCDAVAHGGPLTAHGSPTAETHLRAVGAALHTHLPPSHAATLTLTGTQVALDDTFPFSGERTARRIEGTLNGGGPPLQLRAVQGRAQCTVEPEA